MANVLTGTFQPRVKGATTSRSPNVGSLMDQLADGTIFIPDYQRDSSEWDLAKKSLFVDSLINNMTVPPLILYPETNPNTGLEKSEVVDGQQRLATIRDFVNGSFDLATEDEVEYASNVGPVIQGRRFAELPEPIQRSIRYYVLNLLVLPTNLTWVSGLRSFAASTKPARHSAPTTSVSRSSVNAIAFTSFASLGSSIQVAKGQPA